LFGVYAGCHPQRASDVLELCREQLALAAAGGITTEELERGKGQMRGGLVLGLEDTGSRMSRLGKSELVYGELMTVDELLGHIDAVTVEDAQMLAFELLRGPTALAVIGPYDDDRVLTASVA
jgi:predicted Zn-dependent peptidase